MVTENALAAIDLTVTGELRDLHCRPAMLSRSPLQSVALERSEARRELLATPAS